MGTSPGGPLSLVGPAREARVETWLYAKMLSMTGAAHQSERFRISAGAMWFLVLVSFAVTRLSILPGVLDLQGDEELYRDWAVSIAGGQFPVGDETYQYPPGAGLAFWFQEVVPGEFHRAFTLTMIASDVLILALLLFCVAKRSASWRGPWAWVVGGALSGTLLYERYDVLPTLLAVASLLAVARPYLAGAIAGVGAMVKIWPIFTLFALRRDQFWKGVIGAVVGMSGVVLLAFVVARDPLSFVMGQTGRGLQIEAAPAAPVLLAAQLGLVSSPTVNRFGSNELDSDLATVAAWSGIAVAVVLLGLLLIHLLRGRFEGVPGYDVALAAVLIFVAFNRVNSSQFFTWIAGISAVVLLDRRSRMLIPIVLSFLSMFTIKEYLGPFFWALQAQNIEPVSLQILRSVLVVSSAVLAWWFVFSGRLYRSSVRDESPVQSPQSGA